MFTPSKGCSVSSLSRFASIALVTFRISEPMIGPLVLCVGSTVTLGLDLAVPGWCSLDFLIDLFVVWVCCVFYDPGCDAELANCERVHV